MDTIFLSYTYNPHPEYEDETKELVKNIKIIAEPQELSVITGFDLGGGAITAKIEQRIEDCDALVALITPCQDDDGDPSLPQFVNDEYSFAKNKKTRDSIITHYLKKSGYVYKSRIHTI